MNFKFDHPELYQKDGFKQILHVKAQFSDFEPGWLDDEYLISAVIPAQEEVIEEEITLKEAAVENAVTATKTIAAATVGTNIILSGAMSQVWGMINGLQLFINLPLFDITFPSLSIKSLQGLIEIANFDILPSNDIFSFTLDFSMDEFEKENEQSDEKFENVGYESTSIIMNMGSLFISFVIFLTLPALLLCLRPCRSKSRLIKDKSEKISTALKGNLFIRFFLEGCLNIAISSVLNIEHANENGGLEWDSSVNAINSVSLIFFTSVILLLPVFLLIFYCLKFKKWGKPGFEERYGAAIAGLRTDRRSSLFYPVNFILRRFALVLVAKFT